MRRLIAAGFLSLLPGLALALEPQPNAAKEPPKPPTLDELYDQLGAAKSEREAVTISRSIVRTQLQSGSDTADLLMARAMKAIESQQLDTALELLTAVVRLSPDYAEGWNKRSTVYFMKNEYTRSIADIAQTLHRNPRHFGAWSGLGAILESIGDKKHAYEAYQKAIGINPFLPGVKKDLEKMRPDVEGRDT